MENAVARVRFEDFGGADGESSASETELCAGASDCSDEEDEEDATRKMVARQNRKGKRSGGFQSMGMADLVSPLPQCTYTSRLYLVYNVMQV